MSEVGQFFIVAFVGSLLAIGMVVAICVFFRKEIIEEIRTFREEKKKAVEPIDVYYQTLRHDWLVYLKTARKTASEWDFLRWYGEVHAFQKYEDGLLKEIKKEIKIREEPLK